LKRRTRTKGRTKKEMSWPWSGGSKAQPEKQQMAVVLVGQQRKKSANERRVEER